MGEPIPMDEMKEALHARVLVRWRNAHGTVKPALAGGTSTERLLERLAQIEDDPADSCRDEVDVIARELGIRRDDELVRPHRRRIAEQISKCRDLVVS